MIREGFSSIRCCSIVYSDGRQRSEDLCQTLESCLVPFTNEHDLQDYVFQQDHVRNHKKHIIFDGLKGQNVALIPWPALNPDPDPTENHWDVLSSCSYSH